MTETPTLRRAWDEEATEWIAWARSPEADHAFWSLNLPAMLDLLPEPGELTVDVACGEGRVARALKERGHRVVGVEGSPALAAAATQADPDFEVHVGDAADLPLPDACADLAISSLALMNLDDMPAAVREVARVVRPGGHFVLSVLHPVNSWGDAGDVPYFATVRYAEQLTHGDLRLTVNDTHRPLSAYLGALEQAGFVVEALREPVPTDAHVAAHPHAARWRERPGFLHVRARRAGGL